jgi:hypothetical protein
LAASAVPGRTMPFERGFTALPGTCLGSGCWLEERAAASLLERVLDSFWEVVREEARVLFSDVKRAFSLERAASSFFIEVRSDVRVWRSVICCLRALMTASWSVVGVSHFSSLRDCRAYLSLSAQSSSSAAQSSSLCLRTLPP